jgi:hypothetical protein
LAHRQCVGFRKVTAGAGWGETKRVVVRICVGEEADKSSTVIELPPALTWCIGKAADRPADTDVDR